MLKLQCALLSLSEFEGCLSSQLLIRVHALFVLSVCSAFAKVSLCESHLFCLKSAFLLVSCYAPSQLVIRVHALLCALLVLSCSHSIFVRWDVRSVPSNVQSSMVYAAVSGKESCSKKEHTDTKQCTGSPFLHQC